ncbi:MAG TPA: SHOCT domain-containing protein [Roseiarcus sp.]|nr:SHOCT domain-containing protein [Roseiarcus sp.]
MPGSVPPAMVVAAPTPVESLSMEDIVKAIERLAELRQKNILTEEEFAAKKAELLSRL